MDQNSHLPKARVQQQPRDEPGARRYHATRPPLGVGAAQQCAAPNSLRLACGLRGCVILAQNSHLPKVGAARRPHGRPGLCR